MGDEDEVDEDAAEIAGPSLNFVGQAHNNIALVDDIYSPGFLLSAA